MKKPIFIALVLTGLFGISFLSPVEAAGPVSNPDAEKWIEFMQKELPLAFCKDGSYFRECFRITRQECLAEAGRLIKNCLDSKREKLLLEFKPEAGRDWGQKVGECSGDAYDRSLVSKKIQSQKCNDASQWIH